MRSHTHEKGLTPMLRYAIAVAREVLRRRTVVAAAYVLVAFPSPQLMAARSSPDAFRWPILRVPELRQSPAIDGLVNAGEWRSSMGFTGVAGNPLGKPFMLPEAQQVHWYLGFHRDMLYIGMRSPHPKGTFPSGRVKEMDDSDVLWGDHTEIQILTNKREDAGRPGKGFYKMMTNGWGAMHDAHMYNGTPGTEDFWSTGGEIKCQVDDSMWQMEMAVQAERVRLPRYHGQKAVIQLVRASGPGGVYFAGLVGGAWMAWQDFAEATFDAKCPAVHLERIGEIMGGSVDTVVAVTGSGKSRQEVSVAVAVEDGKGKVLWQDKRQMAVDPGKTQRASFSNAGLDVTDVDIDGPRNHYECKVTWKDGRSEHVLFHNRLPFMKLTESRATRSTCGGGSSPFTTMASRAKSGRPRRPALRARLPRCWPRPCGSSS